MRWGSATWQWFAVGALAGLLACAEAPTQSDFAPSFAANGTGYGGGCAKSGVVVRDEHELLDAVSHAVPGDVIAIDGMIDIATANVRIATDNVTLTCAARGSGVRLHGSRRIDVFGNGIAVDQLVIDAGGSSLPVLYTGSDQPDCCFNDRFTGNTVTGFQLTGIFVLRTVTGIVIADNRFEGSPTTLSAIHLQGTASDGTIARNTVVVPDGAFAGISVLDGHKMVVEHNAVSGAPFAGLRVGSDDSEWKSNTVDGAPVFGLLFEFPRRTGNVIRNNRLTDAATAGMYVRSACGNLFVGNNLGGNADDVGAIFDVSSGANLLAGHGGLVSDLGAEDCAGDGLPDENTITGHSLIAGGLHIGPVRHVEVAVTLNGESVVLH